jgi:hypothetical protein
MADNFDLKGWMQDNKQGPYKLNENFGGGYVDLKPIGYLREEEDHKKDKEEPGQKGSKGIPHELPSWIDDEEGREYDKYASKNYDDTESGAGLEEKKTGYPAAFLKWVKSDSVVKTKEGYKEQMGQYKKVFKTLADLYKHYQKEYSMDEDVAVGPGIDGGTSLPEVANTDVDTAGYYDVTLHSGQKFKNVKFRTIDSFDTADGKTMMHQDIAKATQSYPGGHGLNEAKPHVVDKEYTHFAVYTPKKPKGDNKNSDTPEEVNKKTGKIITGWDYTGVDKGEIPHWTKIDLKDMLEDEDSNLKPGDFSIRSIEYLKKRGIDPFDHVKNWTSVSNLSESSSAEEMKHDHYYEMARGYKDDGMSMGEVEAKLDDMGCSNATDIALDLFPDDEEGDYEDDLEEADLYKENLARFKRK